jgi:dTDP-4-dehydrorhamnose reductase
MLAAMVTSPSVLVLGGSGFVGSRVLALWRDDLDVVAPSHAELDLLDHNAITSYLRHSKATVLLNLAAGALVDAAEAERGDTHGRVYSLNAELPRVLAKLCAERGTRLVHVSTDYVFDGAQAERPYREEDLPNPLSWYAQTKRFGEDAILASRAAACIARIEMPFTGHDHPRTDFARTCLRRFEAGTAIVGVIDQRITPVFLDDAVRALKLLVTSNFEGVIHVASTDWTTPFDYARAIAARLGFDVDLVRKETFERFAATRPATRPQHSWLDVSRFASLFGRDVLRPFEQELESWVAQLTHVQTKAPA